jgi:hypothetical protein
VKNAIFAIFFGENILKIIASVPDPDFHKKVGKSNPDALSKITSVGAFALIIDFIMH